MTLILAPDLSAQGVARGIAFGVLSYLSFATADALIKASAAHYSVFQIAAIMAIFAMLPVIALAWNQGGFRALLPDRTGLVLLRGLLTAACGICAWNAFAMMPLAEGYAILFAAPILVTAMSPFMLGEQVGWRRASAAVVGFIGVLVMIRPGFIELGAGHALAAIAAVLGALSFTVLKKIGPAERSAPIMAAIFVCVFLASLPVAVLEFVPPSPRDLLAMAVAGLLMGMGQAGLVISTRKAPAVVVAPFQYTQMIWAVLYGMLFFGYRPEPALFVGMALVISAGLYTLWRETQRQGTVNLGAARGEVPARAAR